MALAYKNSGAKINCGELIPAYITATGNDTTATVNGSVLDNRDGQVSQIAAQFVSSASTGTSPTLTLTLQGSVDGTNFATLKDQAGNNIASSATSISSAASIQIDTVGTLRRSFPPFLRVIYTLGGTSPGVTGVASVFVERRPKSALY